MVQYKSRHGTGIDTQERHGATELEFHSLTQSWHALREKRSDFTLLCMPDTITLYSLQNFRDPWLNYYFLPTATLEYKTRGEATRERIGHAFLEGSLSNIIIPTFMFNSECIEGLWERNGKTYQNRFCPAWYRGLYLVCTPPSLLQLLMDIQTRIRQTVFIFLLFHNWNAYWYESVHALSLSSTFSLSHPHFIWNNI